MQHEDHIERYNHNLESLLKENDLALKTLYEYLKNSSIDNMTMLKKEVYKPKIKKDDSKTVVEPEPTVSELEIAETNEISQVRINALWDSYCQAEPTNSQCVK